MHSRAGLVALVFALIISLTSAVPIPIRAGHSLSTLSQWDLIQHDASRLTSITPNSPILTVRSATTGALSGAIAPVDTDDQLVPRGLGAKIRAAFHRLGAKIKGAFKKVGAKIKGAFKKVGSKIKGAFKKVGAKIKGAFQKVGHAIVHVARKIGAGIKKAAKKVWHFVKTTGAKIVKFGLKVISTVQQVAAKVVGFIPGVGKLIGKGIEASSKLTNMISDKIHVNLGKKLEKGMAVMNKAHKILGYIPRRRDLSEEDFYY